jgi:PGF-CTERM protein
MNTERYQLASEMREFQRTLMDNDISARFGLVTYTDQARVRQSMTDDFSAVEGAMQFQPQGNVERASDALIAADAMNFRSDAKRVFVLMTDEDDDSSTSMRQQALGAIGDDVFIAVSPADPRASGCDKHYEPCDNSSSNELKQHTEQVGGDWIDIDTDASETMRQVASIVADAAGSTGSGSDGSGSIDYDLGPNISVTNTTINRTTVEVGEPIAVNATLENDGLVEGSIEVFATSNGRLLQNETVTVERLSERSVSLVHAFEEPGNYSVVLNNERVTNVYATEIAETHVVLETSPARNRVTARVSEATAAEPIEIALPSASLLSMQGAKLTGVTVTTEPGIVRPVHDVAFDMAIERTTTPPGETAALPEDAAAVTYLSVTSTLADSDISSVAFQFADTANDVTMYRYDRDSETWTTLSEKGIPEENGKLSVKTSQLSWFAVAVEGSMVSVESVKTGSTEISEGDLLSSTVTVKNYGTSERSFDATISLDGEIVHSETVTVPAGETVDVDVAYAPVSSGKYDLSIAGTDQGVLVVEPASGTDSAESSDRSQQSTTSAGSDDATTTRSDTTTTQPDGPTPGFGPIVAIIAVLLATGYAHLRRF